MSSKQIDLTGDPVWMPEHLQQIWPGSAANRDNATDLRDLNREAWCRDCLRRVTVGTEGVEYGHDLDCRHSCWGDS